MGVKAKLIIFVLFIATAKAAEGSIEFWRDSVTLTCPENADGISEVRWFRETTNFVNDSGICTFKYKDEFSKLHYCKRGEGEPITYFFMKGKVCENCFELEANLFALVIVLDVIGTAIVMVLIYKCTKNKGSAGPVRSSKAPSLSGGPAPPTPSRDYEQLNVHTRNQETYSIVNRTG